MIIKKIALVNLIALTLSRELVAGSGLSCEVGELKPSQGTPDSQQPGSLQGLREPLLKKTPSLATTETSRTSATRAELLTDKLQAEAPPTCTPAVGKPCRLIILDHRFSLEEVQALFAHREEFYHGTHFRIAQFEDRDLTLIFPLLPVTTVFLEIVRDDQGETFETLPPDTTVEPALVHLKKLTHLSLVHWDFRWPLRIPRSTRTLSLDRVNLHEPERDQGLAGLFWVGNQLEDLTLLNCAQSDQTEKYEVEPLQWSFLACRHQSLKNVKRLTLDNEASENFRGYIGFFGDLTHLTLLQVSHWDENFFNLLKRVIDFKFKCLTLPRMADEDLEERLITRLNTLSYCFRSKSISAQSMTFFFQ